jgi:hypothetical protein
MRKFRQSISRIVVYGLLSAFTVTGFGSCCCLSMNSTIPGHQYDYKPNLAHKDGRNAHTAEKKSFAAAEQKEACNSGSIAN